MYVRPPSPSRSGMKLPENYSGNAFSRQESTYSEMPPPLRPLTPRYESKSVDSLPSRDLPLEEIKQDFAPPPYFTDDGEIYESREQKKTEPAQALPAGTSVFSSLLPKASFEDHFPFGHGIGSEELLILAVMLMVFLSGNESGEVDSEFMLMLGLLLFAG